MSFSLLPDYMTDAVTDLSVQWLSAHGITLLMMDFDNTIIPYTAAEPAQKMQNWLQNLSHSDIRLCVVSNSKRERVKIFCEKYGIVCITHANKPFSRGIRAALAHFACDPAKAALVGDQIYTDTLGANCAGVTSVLVKAIDNHNFWLKARHVLEMPFIYLARKRRI